MKLMVVDNAHIFKSPEGNYYSKTIYDYEFFNRYLTVFDQVRFVAKVKKVNNINENEYKLVSGKNLEIFELTWYVGFKEMIRKVFSLIPRYKKASKNMDCYLFRVAQVESFLTYIFASKRKIFALEVVNDPRSFKDVNFLVRWFYVTMLKSMIKRASAVSYVTEKYLQNSYPINPKKTIVTSSYSSVSISQSAIQSNKDFSQRTNKDVFRIVHVSNNIDGLSKGHKMVIDVAKKLIDEGYKIEINFIGDGNSVEFFQKYSIECEIPNNVNFHGRYSSVQQLYSEIRRNDLFFFPSYYEGLPRVILEAQANGLPCIASNVGGIPELIDSQYVFDPLDMDSYANVIRRLMNNPDELTKMSIQGINNVSKYTNEKLSSKRKVFYEQFRQIANKES